MSMKNCPYCAEEIKVEAIKCKHCGSTMPEVHEEIQKQQIEAEQAKEAEACSITSKYAKGALGRSYFWGIFGLSLPIVLGVLLKTIDPEINVFLEPIFWGICLAFGYLLWGMFWGILIVHRPIKDFYNRLFVFSHEGIVGLIVTILLYQLGMYLITIPLFGLVVGSLGGGLVKHFQFLKLSKINAAQ